MTIIISLTIQTVILNYSTRTVELNDSINLAVDETQRQLMDETTIGSDEEYQEAFTDNFLRYITSDSDIKIDFYSSDYQNGLLDVQVTETYSFKGTDGATKSRKFIERRTSIIDTYSASTYNNTTGTSSSSYNAILDQDNIFITYDLSNDINLDFSKYTSDDTKTSKIDNSAVILTEIPKYEAGEEHSCNIRIKSGTVKKVKVTSDDDKSELVDWKVEGGYLKVTIKNTSSDTTIKIN